MSLERRLRRTQAKQSFTRLGKQWMEAKSDQERRIATGEGLGENERRLGRKPPLRGFIKIHENAFKAPKVPMRGPAHEHDHAHHDHPAEPEVDKNWGEQ